MIIEGLFNALFGIFDLIFGWINLPDVPDSFMNTITTYFGYIFNNLQLIYLFIRPVTIKTAIPIFIAIMNFDKIYRFTMFLIRKLPIGVK